MEELRRLRGPFVGTVKREKPKKDQVGKPRATDVRITAPSEAVRKYLAEQGDKLFDVKKPAKLHRLRPLFGK